MRLLGFEFRRVKKNGKGRRRFRRGYEAADINRLTGDWTTTSRSADAELAGKIRIIRARSRDLAMNDDYGRRFLQLCKGGIVGPHGIGCQVRSRDPNGELDKAANAIIESGFKDWGRLGSCTVDGRLSWFDAQNLFVETLARDGEVLVRFVRGFRGNPYGFALQFIDPDHLDDTYNATLPGGRQVRLGVEYDGSDRVLAYHVLNRHPHTLLHDAAVGRERTRYPADQMLHSFLTERSRQGRGIPWTAASLKRLKWLGLYESTELVAARVGASKMGFFIEPEDTNPGDDLEDDFTPISSAEPGTFDRLPEGTEFQSWDPEHPVAAFENFVLAVLRGASSGLGVSYTNLANDLRSVSYSSIRQGELNERDHWRGLQTFTIEHFAAPVFAAWLDMALINQALGALPFSKFAKFNAPVWRPRGWAWVDPLKESKANESAVKNGFKSMTDVVAESGRDIEEVFDQLAQEKNLADEYGLTLGAINQGGGDA